jgi:type II secretory pathway component PulF
MPVTVRPARQAKGQLSSPGRLGERDVADLVSDLAALLAAGSDIRSALTILGGKSAKASVQACAKAMARDISGGDSVEAALGRQLARRHEFIAALCAAGEASGDLVGGLERGAEMLTARLRIRDQLVSALSYPTFVMVTAIFALLIILILVVPSLAPLAEAPGAEPGMAMSIMLGASTMLRSNGVFLAGGLLLFTAAVALAGLAGLLRAWLEWLVLEGPFKATASGLIYGSFAIALGGILGAGAPVNDALRLALRAVQSNLARKRLEPIGHAVRQGESLSVALGRVRGAPIAVTRLAMIGEESGALGPMLMRAGRLSEQAALRRVEALGKILGPAMIVLLGGAIGLLMAGLLSGISGLGDAALT